MKEQLINGWYRFSKNMIVGLIAYICVLGVSREWGLIVALSAILAIQDWQQ